jgi:hypothetical protein
VGLRLALALVNRAANDDHIEVVQRLMHGGPQPDVRSCWECFQPKFFHQVCARLAEVLSLTTRDEIIVAAQVLNVLLGTAVLLLGYELIYRLTADRLTRFMAASWLALNPALLGINVQATNDTLVILAGAVVIVSLHAWLVAGAGSRGPLAIAIVAAALAPHIKGNGLVVAAVAVALIIAIAWMKSGRGRAFRVATIVLVFVAILAGASRVNRSYQANRALTGSWLSINMRPEPLPSFFRHSEVRRPGVTSIASAYFTFRPVDLLRTPYVPGQARPYPLHKTSLWSQLYGRTYVLHFEQAPRAWANRSTAALTTARILLVLGLLPAGLVAVGLIRTLRQPRQLTLEAVVFLAFVVAFLTFVGYYSARYRDVATMKAIFILPAVTAFLFFYVKGLSHWLNRPWMRRVLVPAHVAMLGLWIFESLQLLAQLAGTKS